MSAILVEIASRVVIGLLMSVGIILLASTFHERSHWLVGRIWTEDLSIIRISGLFPVSVDFDSPYDLPPSGMRLVGIAPFLFYFPLTVALFVVFGYPLTFELLLTAPFWAAAILSPSDLLAFIYPERFQEIALKNESIGHFEALRLLLDEFRS